MSKVAPPRGLSRLGRKVWNGGRELQSIALALLVALPVTIVAAVNAQTDLRAFAGLCLCASGPLSIAGGVLRACAHRIGASSIGYSRQKQQLALVVAALAITVALLTYSIYIGLPYALMYIALLAYEVGIIH